MTVELVSAESHVITGEATELYARGIEGEIGILPGHAPALIALDVGPVRITMADGARERVAVHRGVLFVGPDGKVIVLADIAERAEDIDVGRARQKLERLTARLDSGDATNPEALRVSQRKQELRIAVAENTGIAHDVEHAGT